MKKWKIILAFVVLLAAVALGMTYLRFADEADPSQRPAAPMLWLAKSMKAIELENEWSRRVLKREMIAEFFETPPNAPEPRPSVNAPAAKPADGDEATPHGNGKPSDPPQGKR